MIHDTLQAMDAQRWVARGKQCGLPQPHHGPTWRQCVWAESAPDEQWGLRIHAQRLSQRSTCIVERLDVFKACQDSTSRTACPPMSRSSNVKTAENLMVAAVADGYALQATPRQHQQGCTNNNTLLLMLLCSECRPTLSVWWASKHYLVFCHQSLCRFPPAAWPQCSG